MVLCHIFTRIIAAVTHSGSSYVISVITVFPELLQLSLTSKSESLDL